MRRRGIADLQCQVKDQIPGLGLVRFDVAVPSIRWVLEVDVHPEHRTIEGSGKDHRRDRRSRRAGWCVQRVGEVELMTAFDDLMDGLVHGIEDRRREVDASRRAGVYLVEPPR